MYNQTNTAVIIWGTGMVFEKLLPEIKERYNTQKIIAVDANPELWGKKIKDIDIFSPNVISDYEDCVVFIATINGLKSVKEKLINRYQLDEDRIEADFATKLYSETFAVRQTFLISTANVINGRGIEGSCAEGGVFEGDFARIINEHFPDRTLYLFDTFEGFDGRDLVNEDEYVSMRERGFNSEEAAPNFIIEKMITPENVIIKKGFFPDTTKGVEDRFAFVNLDFDLYAPTLAGLEFFWPRMNKGGVILVHDYFAPLLFDKCSFTKVRQAVDEFSEKYNVGFIPIGDKLSVCFIK